MVYIEIENEVADVRYRMQRISPDVPNIMLSKQGTLVFSIPLSSHSSCQPAV